VRGFGFVLVVSVLLGVICVILYSPKTSDTKAAAIAILPSTRTASSATFSLGQPFHVGYWEYTVHSALFHTVVYETTGVRQPDSGSFLMLDVTVRNLDRTSSNRPPLTLVDEAGREFSETDTWDKDQLSALQVLNPMVAKRGHVWFDAPQGYYRLQVSGGYQSGGQLAYVDLVTPVAVQKGRDDWRRSAFDLEANLPDSVADAALTNEERAQIYKVIDEASLRWPSAKAKPETLMSARAGFIGLAEDGSQQILVRGPETPDFCGASGNCPMWIFLRRSGQLQLALETNGVTVTLRDSFSHGFHDLATASHMGSGEYDYAVYGWNGAKYHEVDCYTEKSWTTPPVITDCKKITDQPSRSGQTYVGTETPIKK